MFSTVLELSKIIRRAGNSPVVLKNHTGRAEPLFIALIYNGPHGEGSAKIYLVSRTVPYNNEVEKM